MGTPITPKPPVRGKLQDLTGYRSGRIVVISYAGRIKKQTMWNCVCDCGTPTTVNASCIRTNRTQSCGCLHKEKFNNFRHGEARVKKHTKEYRTWALVIHRCCNSKSTRYSQYGGRGIEICSKWRWSFSSFLQDMGRAPSPYHSIDRIDNNGNYEPGNCRWATTKQQSNNRRNNRLVTCNGETLTMSQWSEKTGIRVATIWARLHKGWSDSDAVFTPVR